MTKITLGNDFSDEENKPAGSSTEESDEKTTDDESEDEKDNSADTDDSKKPEEEEAGDESDDDNDAGGDDADDKSDKTAKEAELQGLLNTEKALDGNIGDIDTAIAAARTRISQKRGERRDKRELIGVIDSKFPEIKEDEDTDDLSDIDPETIKLLDRFTKAKGLVPKSELAKMSYQEQHKSAQEVFYAEHPEYLPENDTDDVLYNSLKTELSYFAAPTDPKLIPALFAKAHKHVVEQFPDKFKAKDANKKPSNNGDQINKSVRIKTQGIGGKSSGSSGAGSDADKGATKKTYSDVQIRALEDGGWSQEEIKRLTS